MKASDDLFILIRSLNKNEKRYFRLFASRQAGEKKYLQVFDAIDRQKAYDEAALKKKFAGERFLRQFSVVKNYLYKMVLRSLREFHSGKTCEMEIRETLDYLEILSNKGQRGQALKLLERAKKSAIYFQKYQQLLDLIKWERRIISSQSDDHSRLNMLTHDTAEILELLSNANIFQGISSGLWVLFGQRGKARNKAEREAFEKMFRNQLLEDISHAHSIDAQFHFYNSHVYYYRVTGDYEKAYLPGKKVIGLLESKPGLAREEIVKYVSALHNFLLVLFETGRYEECLAYVRKCRSLTADPDFAFYEHLRAKVFNITYGIELDIYSTIGQFERAEKLIPSVEEGLNTFGLQIKDYDKAGFYFAFVSAYIGLAKYRKALPWINKILESGRLDLQPMTRLMNIIVHYELGNTDILENIVKSTYRFLRKKEKLHKFEEVMLNYLRKLKDVSTDRELITSFKSLKMSLTPLLEDPFEKIALDYFDLIAWLDSKIGKKPMGEILAGQEEQRKRAMKG